MLIIDDGRVYHWKGSERPNVLINGNVSMIAASLNHFVALKSDQTIESWGYGQISYSERKALCSPYKIRHIETFHLEKETIKYIDCGWKYILLLTEQGKIYSIGSGDYLGSGDRTDSYFKPKLLQGYEKYSFDRISCGSTHIIAKLVHNGLDIDIHESLKRDFDWFTFGYGFAPTKRLLLNGPRFLKSMDNIEYRRALKLFKSMHGDQFDVENLYIVDNETLQNAFLMEENKLKHKFISSQKLFNSNSWKDSEDRDKKHIVLERFNELVNKYEWNNSTDVKIVPVLHATNAENVWNICSSGFASLAQRDQGNYGRGMYFTTDARYASKFSTTQDTYVFILGYAIPGNVYPVTESYKGKDSLLGHPNKVGYQSHYVTVNKHGNVSRNGKYDELVLFQGKWYIKR